MFVVVGEVFCASVVLFKKGEINYLLGAVLHKKYTIPGLGELSLNADLFNLPFRA